MSGQSISGSGLPGFGTGRSAPPIAKVVAAGKLGGKTNPGWLMSMARWPSAAGAGCGRKRAASEAKSPPGPVWNSQW
jgi:hypothetical protein